MTSRFGKKEIHASIIIIVVVIIEKLLAFIKNIVFANNFGAQSSADMYYLATNIVSLFNSCFMSSVPIAILSVYVNKGYKNASRYDQERVLSQFVSSFSLIAIILTAVLFIFAPLIETILSKRIPDAETSSLSVYVRVLSLIITIYGLSGLFSASLECLDHFVPTKLAPLFESLVTIVLISFLGKYYGVIVAIYGTIIGIGMHSLFSFIVLRKERRISIVKPRFNENVRDVLSLCGPIMLSVGITVINALIDKLIAAGIGEGAVSALNYASLLTIELVSAFLVAAVSTIITSKFAENISSKDYVSLQKNARVVIKAMLLISIPIAVFYLINAKEIIRFIFERGAFDSHATDITSVAFIGYSFGLLFLPFREVYIRIQYAYQDSVHPMVNSVVCVFVNIVMSWFLSREIGVLGISIATSVSILLNSILSYFSVRKNAPFSMNINNHEIRILLLYGMPYFLFTYAIKKYFGLSLFLNLFVSATFYFVFMVIVERDFLMSFVRLIKRR